MAENKNIEVGGRLHSIATGNVLAGANEILDDVKGKKQSVINAENDIQLASHESRLNAYTEGKFVTVNNYSALPATGAVDTVYRVSSWDGTANNGQGAVDVTKYSEYAWQNGAYKFLDVKTQIGEVFDISEYNSGAVYTDLANALGNNGINVPSSIRRGGMSVKFKQVITPATYTVVKTEGTTEQPTGTEVQSDPGIISGTYTAGELSVFSTLPANLNSSLTYYLTVTETVDEQEVTTYTTWVITYVHTNDNKYIQARCMAQNFTTDVTQWQGVDEKPILNSMDMVTGDGIIRAMGYNMQGVTDSYSINKYVNELVFEPLTNTAYCKLFLSIAYKSGNNYYNALRLVQYDSNDNVLATTYLVASESYDTEEEALAAQMPYGLVTIGGFKVLFNKIEMFQVNQEEGTVVRPTTLGSNPNIANRSQDVEISQNKNKANDAYNMSIPACQFIGHDEIPTEFSIAEPDVTYTNSYIRQNIGDIQSANGFTVYEYNVSANLLKGPVYIVGSTGSGNNSCIVAFYDSNDRYIGRLFPSAVFTSTTLNNVGIIIPENASKIRIQSASSNLTPALKLATSAVSVNEVLNELQSKTDDAIPSQYSSLTPVETKDNYYLIASNGGTAALNGFQVKKFSVTPNTDYYLTGSTGSGTGSCMAAWYDSNGTVIQPVINKAVDYPSTTWVRYKVTSPSNAAYLNVQKSTLGDKADAEVISGYASVHNIVSQLINREISPNILQGKKWTACGDSNTNGDFTGYTGQKTFNGGKFDGQNMVYPRFIAERNNMELVMNAVNGSMMGLSKDYVDDPDHVDINTGSPFAYQRYLSVPLDSDYITLWFGGNDIPSKEYTGTIDDETNETLYGAWNIVLRYFITNAPFAKIGIIVPYTSTAAIREVVRNVAKKWAIPYLDMAGDAQVPFMYSKESSLGVTSEVETLRREAYRVSETNAHMNPLAHKYQSTFIENWLRSL